MELMPCRKSGKIRAIYNEMLEIIKYDPVFGSWLMGTEKKPAWLLDRLMKCFFIDGESIAYPGLTCADFLKARKRDVMKKITWRRCYLHRKVNGKI